MQLFETIKNHSTKRTNKIWQCMVSPFKKYVTQTLNIQPTDGYMSFYYNKKED